MAVVIVRKRMNWLTGCVLTIDWGRCGVFFGWYGAY